MHRAGIEKPVAPDYCQLLTVMRVMGKGDRMMDHSNLHGGSLISLIDILVDEGFMKDDSPKYLAMPIVIQDDTRRDFGPAIEVTLRREGNACTENR